jgi:hypothetical protein
VVFTTVAGRVGLILLVLAQVVDSASAQSGPTVTADTATVNFPSGILFELEASSAAPLTRAILHYGAEGRACNAGGAQQSVKLDPDTSIAVEWEWDFSEIGVLPPGVRFWWQWELHDAGGAELLTEKQWAAVTDRRYDWQRLERPALTVTWAEGSQAFGAGLLDLSLTSLNRLEREMGVAPSGAVLLVVYPDTDAVGESLLYLPEWTGGVAFPAYNLVVTGIAPGESAWAADVVPHELAHLVVGALIFNCKGVGLPTWLNEGLAVSAEGEPSAGELEPLQAALHAGRLPALRTLANGFQADAGRAALSYAHSGAVVRYLLNAHPPEKMGELLAAVRDGARIDLALERVYGLDTDSLDTAWRQSEGVAITPTPPGAATAAPERTPVPTLSLWTAVPSPAPTLPPASPAPTATPRAVAQADTPTAPAILAPSLAPAATPTPQSLASVPGPRWALWVGGLAGVVALVTFAVLAWRLLLKRK